MNLLLQDMGLDATEIEFYVVVAKALQAFEMEVTGKSRLTKILPKCYLGHYETEGEGKRRFFVVALEDLMKAGYTQYDFNNGLSLADVKPMVTSMATLHAVSYVYASVKSVDWSKAFPNMSDLPKNTYHPSVTKLVNEALTIYMKTDDPDKQARLETFSTKLEGDWARLVTGSKHKCIVHGDFWATNAMRSPDPSAPTSTLLDFQVSSCGHPMYEIGVAILYNPDVEQVEGHRYELLEQYYNTFNEIVEELDVKKKVAPFWESFEEIKKDFDNEGYLSALRFALPRAFLQERYT